MHVFIWFRMPFVLNTALQYTSPALRFGYASTSVLANWVLGILLKMLGKSGRIKASEFIAVDSLLQGLRRRGK